MTRSSANETRIISTSCSACGHVRPYVSRSAGIRRFESQLFPRRHRPLVDNHPVDAESISQLGESGGEKRLLYRHEHFAALRESRKDAFRFGVTLDAQRQISTPHRLSGRNVGAH